MNKIIKLILLIVVTFTTTTVSAQQRRISGTVSDDFDVVPGANVVERDKNNRIVSAVVTDMNGNFTLNIKDPNNNLTVTFMGLKPWSQKIGNRTVFKIKLEDNTKQMKEVVKTAKKVWPSSLLTRPCRVRSQVSISWPIPVTSVPVPPCACAVPLLLMVTHSR